MEELPTTPDATGEFLGRPRRQPCATSRRARRRRPPPTSCASLQSRPFFARAGDARADQRLVDDDSQRESHQDRREGRQPCSLRRLSDGGGRHSTGPVRRDFANDR